MSYTNFYPNGNLEDQPVAQVDITLGDQNGWVSQKVTDPQDPAVQSATPVIPNGAYTEIRVTAVRIDFNTTVNNRLAGFVDVTGGGAIIVGEGQTVKLANVADSSLLSFATQPGLDLIINADV